MPAFILLLDDNQACRRRATASTAHHDQRQEAGYRLSRRAGCQACPANWPPSARRGPRPGQGRCRSRPRRG